MFEKIKQELSIRKIEDEELSRKIKNEAIRIEEEMETNTSHFMNFGFIKNHRDKKRRIEINRQVAEYGSNERRLLKEKRASRRKDWIGEVKKTVIIAVSIIVVATVALVASISLKNYITNKNNYNKSVNYIVKGNYDKAITLLNETDYEDSDALYNYCELQIQFEEKEYDNLSSIYDDIKQVDDIENKKIEKQRKRVLDQLNRCIEVQSDINQLDKEEINLESKDNVDSIFKRIKKIEKRYLELLDLEKYESAQTTIYHLENQTAVGKIIEDIRGIDDITLDEKEEIESIKRRYDLLSFEEMLEVVNSEKLYTAVSLLEELEDNKKEEEAKIRAEAEAKKQAELEAKKKEEAKKKKEQAKKKKQAQKKKRKKKKKKRRSAKAPVVKYYWSTSGSSYAYHSSPYCFRLKRSKHIAEGTNPPSGFTPCPNCY